MKWACRLIRSCAIPVSMIVCPLIAADHAAAQSSRRPAPPPQANAKVLDQQADKIMTDYLAGLADLAGKYEEAGEKEKAIGMLSSILKIKPDAEVVKARIKSLEESVFKGNEILVDVEAGAGWIQTGLMVTKDKPVRIEAEGTYRVSLSEQLGPAGYPSNDLAFEVIDNVPFGCLVALVGKGPTPGGRRGQQKDGPQVVEIGNEKEFSPNQSGQLLLKINLPQSAKGNGKIKVKISGNFDRSR